MFNLLRMDLYRIKRSKSVYVCFGALLLCATALFLLLWLMMTPQGQQAAVKLGMLSAQEAGKNADLLHGMDRIDTLKMLRQMGLNGGNYNMIFGIWVMLFVCGDYQSGFIKNVMALHHNRWNYAASKIVAAGIVDACYLLLYYAFLLALNGMFGNMAPYANIGDTVFYMAWAWLLTTAFGALVTVVCVLTRSVAAGTLAAVLFGTGTVVAVLQGILDMFHIGGWLQHTIYLTLSEGPSHYASLSDLRVFAVGGGFLVLYTVLTGIILKKRDI